MPRASKVTDPSYELMDDHEGHSLIYRQHGFPSPLVRWHFHKEYELHLIVASSGKVFIGDYIGNSRPDTLFLTGPNLPHNWISQVEPDEVVARRDMLVNFTDEVLEDGSGVFSELNRLAPLLARARYGIEFRDPALIGESRRLLQRIADSGGMTRLGYFLSSWNSSPNARTTSCSPPSRPRNWPTSTTSNGSTGRWTTSSSTTPRTSPRSRSPPTWA